MSRENVVTIHQPDFMPWLGFFNKVWRADLFVLLDHVHNNPRDGSWFRRVRMLISGEPKWVSLPIVKTKGVVSLPLNEMRLNVGDRDFEKKALATIRQNYGKHAFFDEVFPLVEAYFTSDETGLCARNMAFITEVMRRLEITTEIVSSTGMDCEEASNELLIEILKKTSGTVYLCGGGAEGYQIDELYAENGIELRYNAFEHPVYPQRNSQDFVAGLSIVDPLMNVGWEETGRLVRGT